MYEEDILFMSWNITLLEIQSLSESDDIHVLDTTFYMNGVKTTVD